MANELINQTLSIFFKAAMQDVNTQMPVQVVKVGTNSVDVQPLIRKKVREEDGSESDELLPIIPNVLVGGFYAGGFEVAMPIKVGDQGSLRIYQRDVRNWRTTRQAANQKTKRRFNINDCIYVPDIMPATSTIPTDGIYLQTGSLFFSIKSDKIVTNMNIECENITAKQINADNITTPTADFNGHVHPESGGGTTGTPQ